ncbi:MAG TPA: prepilin-type N-terminal cleavage/methylation domain-containing protein [Nonomuraea sp.]|nr:prepilin-type N-terminal cleavage/methylation domain-containing protein [Nonomuraea sp.]
MSARERRGFTIAEVLVAVVMLTVGVMALVGSSAMVTRMVGGGRISTFAGQTASARIERLRQIAASTPTPCTSGLWKTDSALTGNINERWEIQDNAGNSRRVQITLRYPVARGLAYDTVNTRILCK